MDHRTKRRRLRDAERQNVLGMGVNHRVDVRPRLVDGGMDEALEIERALVVAHRLPVEPQLDDVVALDQLGRDRAGQEKVLGIAGMADADVAVGVHHILLGEDAVGDDEVLDDGVELLMTG